MVALGGGVPVFGFPGAVASVEPDPELQLLKASATNLDWLQFQASPQMLVRFLVEMAVQ